MTTLVDDTQAAQWPAWVTKLGLRLASLEGDRVYNVLVIVPQHGDPSWSVVGDAKLENHNTRKDSRHE